MILRAIYPPPPKSLQFALDGFSLDSVAPLTPSGRIPTDTLVTFYIHIKNMYGIPRFGLQNGFRIYSPDGASWNNITADTNSLAGYSWDAMFDAGVNFTYVNADGYGADTIGIGGVSFFGTGLAAYFDETAYTITIGPIDESMDGRTICLDSCFFPPAGSWQWFNEAGHGSVPPWWGPYACEIENPNTTIMYSGHLYYMNPVPPLPNPPLPMRYVTIEMWDDDAWPNDDDSLGIDFATETGFFEFGPIENSDIVGELDIYFKIFAENGAAYVTDEYNSGTIFIQTPTQNNLPSGNYDTTIITTVENSGPFYIADALLDAQATFSSLTSYYADIVQVVSDNIDTGSWYSRTHDYIHIRNREPNPDTYDKGIIFHEYGHFLEDILLFMDQDAAEHEWDELITPELAGTEGFATFISCVFRNDYICRDYYNDFTDTFWVNAENGCMGVNGERSNSGNNYGAACEAAACGILWDIFDDNDDDFSTYGIFLIPNDSNPDGIGDTLSNGIGNILDVLLNRYIEDHHPDNINEFWSAWFQSPSKGHVYGMRDIWLEHGIATCGDANGDGAANVGDVVFLINYIFKEGLAPNPLDLSDVNSDSFVNIGDPVYLINWLFRGGPAPNCS